MPKTYFLKRTFDVLLATAGLMFFLPLWGILIVLIWLESGGPIFYIQDRMGEGGRIFKTMKFRTLYCKESNNLQPTRLGGILRITAMDESLQLINILKADMSFVGPRPLIPQEVASIKEINPRFSVKPGLTGLAQIAVSKETDILDKFKYDLWYIENQNLFLDLRLIILSLVISCRGKWETNEAKLSPNVRLF